MSLPRDRGDETRGAGATTADAAGTAGSDGSPVSAARALAAGSVGSEVAGARAWVVRSGCATSVPGMTAEELDFAAFLEGFEAGGDAGGDAD